MKLIGQFIIIIICSVFYSCTRTKTEYYLSGEIKSKSEFKKGELNGKSIVYYKNGTLKNESNFVNDKLSGIKKVYLPDGNLDWTANYDNGKLHGIFKSYYPTGGTPVTQPSTAVQQDNTRVDLQQY